MGKYGDKFPQSLGAHLIDEEIALDEVLWGRQMHLVEREEEFRERMVEKKLEAMNRFSDSIMALAVAISDRSTAPNVINIYADKDLDIEKILSTTSGKVYYNGMIDN